MSELPDALNEVRYKIEIYLQSLGIQFQGRNRKIKIDNKKPWARMNHLPVSSQSAQLGDLWIRDRGLIVVSFFFPAGAGVAESDRIIYNLRDSFSEWRYNYLELGVGEITEVPTTEDFYHVNVTLPYRHK